MDDVFRARRLAASGTIVKFRARRHVSPFWIIIGVIVLCLASGYFLGLPALLRSYL